MEAVEEPPLQDVVVESVKIIDVSSEVNAEAEASVPSDECQKSNGVAESKNSENVIASPDDTPIPNEIHPYEAATEEENKATKETIKQESLSPLAVETTAIEFVEKEIPALEVTKDVAMTETDKHDELEHIDTDDIQTEVVEVDGIVETSAENVTFETEILIETNIEDQISKVKSDEPDTNNVLNDIGQNIELSEALRSSDVTGNVENNNCEGQEVFNKEELLDILEGNDIEQSRKVISENFPSDCKKLEAQLALQQLSRLNAPRKTRHSLKKTDKRISKKNESPRKSNTQKEANNSYSNTEPQKHEDSTKKSGQSFEAKAKEDNTEPQKRDESTKKSGKSAEAKPKEDNVETQKRDDSTKKSGKSSEVKPKEENIVNALVKDWEDDEPLEGDQSSKLPEEDEKESIHPEDPAINLEAAGDQNESMASNADASMTDDQALKLKSENDAQPQRRLGRVIKKKVIFDPDNPDTFTKSKVNIKKENQTEKDTTPKKKTDPTSPRSKSKSPVSKLQWKKPQPKNSKQNKRLTEIDRLLMDEGAVNMICQLTPEAAKGHKNMKSKAEFIKKIQSSTPDTKEMKFRERKKDYKYEDGDAKRVGSGKERLSLSSSVKSPAVSDDFEAHSADDSIIYRRHSSSSYSSSCMSPRRLSDVESVNQSGIVISQIVSTNSQSHIKQEVSEAADPDVFMSENASTLAAGMLNKNDVLLIKEKLNSKLSQALNKRKRDSMKADKPPKIKKVSKTVEKSERFADYKYVRVVKDQKLAEICVVYPGSVYNIEVIKDLESALQIVNSNKDISVTLLTSESGNLCSGIDLKPLLDVQSGSTYAHEIAECVRSLLCTLESHSKLVCAAIEDRCQSLGLSLVALSDITLASERASFEWSSGSDMPLQPGAAVITAQWLPQFLLNELIVFGRKISASEALRSGLVSRIIWPEKFQEQSRAFAKHLAAQPAENIMLKKQLLKLKRTGSEALLSSLEKERDLFVKYWTSTEGRELVRASIENA